MEVPSFVPHHHSLTPPVSLSSLTPTRLPTSLAHPLPLPHRTAIHLRVALLSSPSASHPECPPPPLAALCQAHPSPGYDVMEEARARQHNIFRLSTSLPIPPATQNHQQWPSVLHKYLPPASQSSSPIVSFPGTAAHGGGQRCAGGHCVPHILEVH